jgi:5'-nucleotidase
VAVDLLAQAPPATVLNVNVPDVPLARVAGVRRARLGTSGTIRSAVHEAAGPAEAHIALPPAPSGTLRLDLAPPRTGTSQDPGTDATLLSHDHVTVTALTGVREARGADAVAEQAVAAAAAALAAGSGQRRVAG